MSTVNKVSQPDGRNVYQLDATLAAAIQQVIKDLSESVSQGSFVDMVTGVLHDPERLKSYLNAELNDTFLVAFADAGYSVSLDIKEIINDQIWLNLTALVNLKVHPMEKLLRIFKVDFVELPVGIIVKAQNSYAVKNCYSEILPDIRYGMISTPMADLPKLCNQLYLKQISQTLDSLQTVDSYFAQVQEHDSQTLQDCFTTLFSQHRIGGGVPVTKMVDAQWRQEATELVKKFQAENAEAS
jgi:hypothetical protein